MTQDEIETVKTFLVDRYAEVDAESENLDEIYRKRPSGTLRMRRNRCRLLSEYLTFLLERCDGLLD